MPVDFQKCAPLHHTPHPPQLLRESVSGLSLSLPGASSLGHVAPSSSPPRVWVHQSRKGGLEWGASRGVVGPKLVLGSGVGVGARGQRLVTAGRERAQKEPLLPPLPADLWQ